VKRWVERQTQNEWEESEKEGEIVEDGAAMVWREM
jgi:hypothetical protein